MADTHYIHNPDIFTQMTSSHGTRHSLAQLWSARAEHAWTLAGSLGSDFIVHLGDLTQEYPGRGEDFIKARAEAQEQFKRMGLQPYVVAGNMDIGDKSDLTMPAQWVTPATLADWHSQFGRSWYSFDRHGVHFVCLNSQILDGPLPEVTEQREWLESDLAEHSGERIFLFLHIPPFFVDEHEPGIGHYNVLNEPPRKWLLDLLRRHKVELLFSGHMHFAAFNRVDETRHYLVPSTTLTRGIFYEVFSVLPPDHGINDIDKLGFYLVRVHADGARIHFVRTRGETNPDGSGVVPQLITRISRDLPDSPLGVYLSLPLAKESDGATAYTGSVRQPVRDDYPFLGCLELGIRHLRVPASDLVDDLQRRRLAMARDERVQVTGVWLWSEHLNLEEVVRHHADQIDAVELQTPGMLWPESKQLKDIERCRHEVGVTVTLAPLLAREPMTNTFFPRVRIGYHAAELEELNTRLSQSGNHVDRVLCHVRADARPWEAIQDFVRVLPLSHIGSLDFIVQLPGLDENSQIGRAAEAVMAAALLRGGRLFLDPLVEMDRAEYRFGLLDRLSNPRSVFHAVRCLNTIIFASSDDFQPMECENVEGGNLLGLQSRTKRLWLLLPNGRMSVSPAALDGLNTQGEEVSFIDLTAATKQTIVPREEELRKALSDIEKPVLLMSAQAE